MYVILIAILFLIMFYLYQRYFPIWYVQKFNLSSNRQIDRNIIFVDVRDYQIASREPVQGALNLPYAYLKRHYKQITSCQVVVVASDPVLKNLSIRFLKGQGFNVVGYQLIK